ncbi:MAG: methylated-DNA--[protein]-cysteine S-methyltransferase [Chloroflexi bacterium]|nr:methylated-DNA--[protein]-cysteine S-methyltransferase [Chloroflexota bacterium]
MTYFTFQTKIGWVGVVGSDKGLRRLVFARQSPEDMPEIPIGTATWAPDLYRDLAERLKSYFSGHCVAFPDGFDLSGTTGFQQSVWQVTCAIPFGETRSYGWVAAQIGRPKGMRAVGQALGSNPLPIVIPCHRVITGDGRLGGYGGGLEMKEHLLRLEAAAKIG